MEVDQVETMAAIAPLRVQVKEMDTMKELDTFKRQISGLSKQFIIMIPTQNRQPAPTAQGNQWAEQHTEAQPQPTPGRNFKFTEDGRIICAHCHRIGHLWRNCRLI